MHFKSPNWKSGNSFISVGDSYNDESSSDYDEILETQSEGNDTNDFSEFMWMENEEEFEDQVFQTLEEEELTNECLEVMNEEVLREEVEDIQYEIQHENFESRNMAAGRSSLNPMAEEFVPSRVAAN